MEGYSKKGKEDVGDIKKAKVFKISFDMTKFGVSQCVCACVCVCLCV